MTTFAPDAPTERNHCRTTDLTESALGLGGLLLFLLFCGEVRGRHHGLELLLFLFLFGLDFGRADAQVLLRKIERITRALNRLLQSELVAGEILRLAVLNFFQSSQHLFFARG